MGLGAGDGGAAASPGWGRLAAEGCTSTGATMSVAAAAAGGHGCCRCGGGHCSVNIYVNNNVQGVTNSVLVGSKVVMRDPGARVTSRRRRGGRRKVKETNRTGIVAGVMLCVAAGAAAAVFCLYIFVRLRNLH